MALMRMNKRGNALLGAMTAVAVTGFIGSAMVAYYESFVRQSRMAYVRAILTSVDNKVRFMAQQPYAYICGQERTGSVASQLDGIRGCVINEQYFARIAQTVVPGAVCANGASCGIRLILRPAVAGHPPLDFTTATNPVSGATESVGLFPYQLIYEGSEFSLRPGGYDLRNNPTGMMVPREILQSQIFDCSAVDPTRPVFGGFDAGGSPICRGFNECPTGTYGSALDFRTLVMTCLPLVTPDKNVNCSSGQTKISNVNFAGGALTSSCSELPVPELGPDDSTGGVVVNPPPGVTGTPGVCGPTNGSPISSAPTAGLCTTGAPSAVAGSGPWTWTCAGQNGGGDANCSAGGSSGGAIWFARNYSGWINGAIGCTALGGSGVGAPSGPCTNVGQYCNFTNFNAIAGSAQAHAQCMEKSDAFAQCMATASNPIQVMACNALYK